MDNENDKENNSGDVPDFKDVISQTINNYVENPDVSNQIKNSTTRLTGSFEDYFKDTEILDTLSELTAPTVDLIVSTQPYVFDSVRELADFISNSSVFNSIIDTLKPIIEIITNKRFINILRRAQWPLYINTNQDLINEIVQLNDEESDGSLAASVDAIAQKYLDSEWLREIKGQWQSSNIVTKKEKLLLQKALDFHDIGEYFGCVAILICLLDKLIKKYGLDSYDFAVNHEELVNQRFKHYRYSNKNIKNKDKLSAKQCIILYSTRVDYKNSIWKYSIDYIFYYIYVSKDKKWLAKRLATHNPLRNSICHGEQTNYGTWEHSIKAILVIDMLLNMGSVLYTGSNNQTIK